MDPTFVVDMSILVTVGFGDHFVELFFRHLFAEAEHDVPQLLHGDEAVVVFVEDSSMMNFSSDACVLYLPIRLLLLVLVSD